MCLWRDHIKRQMEFLQKSEEFINGCNLDLLQGQCATKWNKSIIRFIVKLCVRARAKLLTASSQLYLPGFPMLFQFVNTNHVYIYEVKTET